MATAEQNYINDKTNHEPYIHLKKTSYLSKRKGTLPTASLIYKNYGQQAEFLENAAFENFNTSSKDKFDAIVKTQKEIMKEMEGEAAFQEIGKILSEDLIDKSIGSKKVSSVKGVKAMTQALGDTAAFLNAVNELTDELNEVDDIFLKYLESKGAKDSVDVNKGRLAILSPSGVKEAKTHADRIFKIKEALKKGSSTDSILKISKSLGTDIIKAKGGIEEVASAMIGKAIYNDLIKDPEKGMRVELMGEEKMFIEDSDSRWNTISAISRNPKHKYGGFRSKSDYVNVVYDFDDNGQRAEIGFVGVSVKSYTAESAYGKKIVDRTPWSNVFTFSDLVGTYFEYNYANMIVHEQEKISTSDTIMNRYLASKAASFMISGVTGIGGGGAGSAPALFMVYSNKAMYIPDIMRDIQAKKSPELKISVAQYPKFNNAQLPATKKLSQETMSYRRSKSVLAKIRGNTKFVGTR